MGVGASFFNNYSELREMSYVFTELANVQNFQ